MNKLLRSKDSAIKFYLLILLSIAGSQAASAGCSSSIPSTTPTSQFTIHGDGTVTDNKTRLMWAQCAQGETVSGGMCTGTPTGHGWGDALGQITPPVGTSDAYDDWRLPNIKELESIVERACVNPAMNIEVFPNAKNLFFASASPFTDNTDLAWGIIFYSGTVTASFRPNDWSVRLVRGGQ